MTMHDFAADIAKTGWYGFPQHPRQGVVKIANHGIGQRLHPADDERVVTEADTLAFRAFLRDTFPSIAAGAQEKFPKYAAHLRDLHSRRYETVAAAHDAGLPIYLGTDAGGSLPHGLAAQEAAELVRAGMSTTEALTAATWSARSWLGRPGLDEGASADLVVYQEDPREDISILAAPARIVMRGKVVL